MKREGPEYESEYKGSDFNDGPRTPSLSRILMVVVFEVFFSIESFFYFHLYPTYLFGFVLCPFFLCFLVVSSAYWCKRAEPLTSGCQLCMLRWGLSAGLCRVRQVKGDGRLSLALALLSAGRLSRRGPRRAPAVGASPGAPL